MAKVESVYCSSCGYEDFDIEIVYVRTVANGNVYECPSCKEETMSVEPNEFTEE